MKTARHQDWIVASSAQRASIRAMKVILRKRQTFSMSPQGFNGFNILPALFSFPCFICKVKSRVSQHFNPLCYDNFVQLALGNGECSMCPDYYAATTTSLPGSTSWEDCKCKPGYNGTISLNGFRSTCEPCPPGITGELQCLVISKVSVLSSLRA